jgi:spore maturation protein CgeB
VKSSTNACAPAFTGRNESAARRVATFMKLVVLASRLTEFADKLLLTMSARGHTVERISPESYGLEHSLDQARDADFLLKVSGLGIFDAWLEHVAVHFKSDRTSVVFWDLDAPSTLHRMKAAFRDPFRPLLPKFDLVLATGGGRRAAEDYVDLGARACVPLYPAVEPAPRSRDPRYESDLSYLSVTCDALAREFLFKPAARLPAMRFVWGTGSGTCDDVQIPANVERVHVEDVSSFFGSAHAVIARPGHLLKVAAAGACPIILDRSNELFGEDEVLRAVDGKHVAELLWSLPPERLRAIGRAAQRRVLAEHTYERRAEELERVLHCSP